MHLLQCFRVGAMSQRFSEEIRDLQHFLFSHAARCDGRRTDADTTRLEDWISIEGDPVLVYGDAGAIENFLRLFAVNFLRAKIDEHQMIIGAAGDDAVTMFGQAGIKRFGVQDHLPLIFAELRLERFMKANGFRCDHMHERTALHAGENSGIDLLGEFLFAHDDTATRSAQTLVRSSGDKLRVLDRTGMLAAGYEACDVRHVDKQICRGLSAETLVRRL